MYRLVYVLIFSAAAVKGAKYITLDINIESKTETSCQVTPKGTQILTEDQPVQFNILTPTKLVDFWCYNGDTLIYPRSSEITTPTKNDAGKMQYTLPGTSTDSKSDMDGMWTCTFQIFKNREGTCLFPVKVTADKPGVSLYVANLRSYNIKNERKQYNYTFFTESVKTFVCILANPTEKKETYTISFKLNDVYQKQFSSVTIKPHSKINFTDVFKLNKESKRIVCSAKNVSFKKSYEADLYNEINLRYIPTPHVHLVTHVQPNPQKLKPREFIPENNTQIYNYDFTDGEEVTINCALNKSDGGYEQYYSPHVVLCIVNKICTKLKDFTWSETSISHKLTLKKGDEFIQCTAYNKENTADPSLPSHLYNVVHLHYTPREDTAVTAPSLTFTGPEKLQLVGKIYSYIFTDGEDVTLNCLLNELNSAVHKKKYSLAIYLKSDYYEKNKRPTYVTSNEEKTAIWRTFTLKKGAEAITCAAFDKETEMFRIDVHLHYNPQPTQGSGLYLEMKGLPDKSNCITYQHQKYNYAFNASDLGTTLHLECVLTRTGGLINKTYDYEITFGTDINKGTFEVNDVSKKALHDITLEEQNTTVKCTGFKVDGNLMTIELNAFYIPPPPIPSSTNEPTTTPTIESTTPNVQVPQPTDPSSQSREGEESSTGWVKWVLVGGALLITICVVVGCLVMHCQKKPPPADSTYANLGKDQNKPTPVPTPRTIQKPNAARKPNVTLENNYSEPKDSQDMSEALYAAPNRFVGDSSNYAEPYVAKPSPQADMYAEPYKSNYAEPYASTSEGNYAELNLPDSGKELYAKPIPKSQRKPKVKDDCNYSNVFGGQYGNTKK